MCDAVQPLRIYFSLQNQSDADESSLVRIQSVWEKLPLLQAFLSILFLNKMKKVQLQCLFPFVY